MPEPCAVGRRWNSARAAVLTKVVTNDAYSRCGFEFVRRGSLVSDRESRFSLTKGHRYEIAFDGGLRARSGSGSSGGAGGSGGTGATLGFWVLGSGSSALENLNQNVEPRTQKWNLEFGGSVLRERFGNHFGLIDKLRTLKSETFGEATSV